MLVTGSGPGDRHPGRAAFLWPPGRGSCKPAFLGCAHWGVPASLSGLPPAQGRPGGWQRGRLLGAVHTQVLKGTCGCVFTALVNTALWPYPWLNSGWPSRAAFAQVQMANHAPRVPRRAAEPLNQKATRLPVPEPPRCPVQSASSPFPRQELLVRWGRTSRSGHPHTRHTNAAAISV